MPSIQQKKTPTKSPPEGQFQSLPSLHDAKLSSPCGIFLSPTPPSPSASSVPTLEKKEKKPEQKDSGEEKEEAKPEVQEEKSAKALDQERERSVATPTDFPLDFGRGLRPTNSFDASNGKCYPVNAYLGYHSLRSLTDGRFHYCPSARLAPVANSKRALLSRRWFGFSVEYSRRGTYGASYTTHTDHEHLFLLLGCCELATEY
jgi:hypothetical protein